MSISKKQPQPPTSSSTITSPETIQIDDITPTKIRYGTLGTLDGRHTDQRLVLTFSPCDNRLDENAVPGGDQTSHPFEPQTFHFFAPLVPWCTKAHDNVDSTFNIVLIDKPGYRTQAIVGVQASVEAHPAVDDGTLIFTFTECLFLYMEHAVIGSWCNCALLFISSLLSQVVATHADPSLLSV